MDTSLEHGKRVPADRYQDRPDFERLLDSEEAASLLRIHPKTLQRMARSGEIKGVQIGKLWRFRASQLDQWMASKFAGDASRGR